jgi:hypothetical protein
VGGIAEILQKRGCELLARWVSVGVEVVTCRMKVLSEGTARRKDKGAGPDAGWREVEDDRNSLPRVCTWQRHRM